MRVKTPHFSTQLPGPLPFRNPTSCKPLVWTDSVTQEWMSEVCEV